ncbi:hypothetical protein AB6A40_005171 [Gnathostoma spinigerum]|uniref:tRNA/rRNA methyltransferase SpoU type domain-containing protein n=1 Tax=Gnathostoma spinigerum TaxID=75299 RepID=A0ABD6EGV8_9BILA
MKVFSFLSISNAFKDPNNIGAVARSSLYFGIDGIVFAQGARPNKITASMSKASAGAIEWLPIISVENFDSFYNLMKERNFTFLATSDQNSAVSRFHKNPIPLPDLGNGWTSWKIVIVLGDENRGVSSDIVDKCDFLVTIPQAARKYTECGVNSLNISVSAAILLNHFCRKGFDL